MLDHSINRINSCCKSKIINFYILYVCNKTFNFVDERSEFKKAMTDIKKPRRCKNDRFIQIVAEHSPKSIIKIQK
jgi:DNA invertase Pin-like site-specific DNA recombinase